MTTRAWEYDGSVTAAWASRMSAIETGRSSEATDPASSLADLSGATDADVVAACLARHPHAFDIIVERHRRTVYHVCYRFVGNHEDASDLSQEVFVRAYRGLGRFRGDAALTTWLHRIAVNVCLNRVSLKTPVHEPLDAAAHVDSRLESAADELLREEQAAQVRRAVSRLPAKQRAALVLRVYQDRSHQEIAATLGTSVGAAKANVFHALRNLKRLLAGEAE